MYLVIIKKGHFITNLCFYKYGIFPYFEITYLCQAVNSI